MNNEVVIDTGDFQAKIYMQTGFVDHKDLCYPLHKHIFVEMHIFLSGTAVLKCDCEDIPLQAGDVLFIPANMMHRYTSLGKDAKRISFLIECENMCKTPSKTAVPQSLIELLCNEIQNYVLTGKDGKLKALLAFVCSDFFTTEKEKNTVPISNRELIIEDFFSKKYNTNATLEDLAKELMLSQKQTAREVKRITGNTFIEEMSKRKLNAAVMLSQTTNLSFAEISELVGYASYCGFYKAYKKMFNIPPSDNH